MSAAPLIARSPFVPREPPVAVLWLLLESNERVRTPPFVMSESQLQTPKRNNFAAAD